MDRSKLFKVNSADIIHESFNDEVVIINLKSGIYYSLNDPGRIIWQLILNNFSPGQIIRIFSRVFPDQNNGYEEKIKQFFSELESEGLVRLYENPEISDAEITPDRYKSFFQGNGSIPGLPSIEKYTDQQELLLLDPIHEVSDLGWPDKIEKGPDNG